MSDTPQDATPLWTDNEIRSKAESLPNVYQIKTIYREAESIMREMRDDYEAQFAAAQQKIASLRAENEQLRRLVPGQDTAQEIGVQSEG